MDSFFMELMKATQWLIHIAYSENDTEKGSLLRETWMLRTR